MKRLLFFLLEFEVANCAVVSHPCRWRRCFRDDTGCPSLFPGIRWSFPAWLNASAIEAKSNSRRWLHPKKKYFICLSNGADTPARIHALLQPRSLSLSACVRRQISGECGEDDIFFMEVTHQNSWSDGKLVQISDAGRAKIKYCFLLLVSFSMLQSVYSSSSVNNLFGDQTSFSICKPGIGQNSLQHSYL